MRRLRASEGTDEDVPICESVQRGLHSLGYTQGRLIATADRPHFSEHAVHDFQAKVLKAPRAHSRSPGANATCVVARGPPITLPPSARLFLDDGVQVRICLESPD